jgi:hypothetical protein
MNPSDDRYITSLRYRPAIFDLEGKAYLDFVQAIGRANTIGDLPDEARDIIKKAEQQKDYATLADAMAASRPAA